MDQKYVKQLLLKYDIVTKDNVKYLEIPLSDLFDANPEECGTLKNTVITSTKYDNEITIPKDISSIYPAAAQQIMLQDVTDFLKLIANCWSLHNYGFTDSILKKASKIGSALNSKAFRYYGEAADSHLINLINNNNDFIHNCWDETAGLSIK